MRVPHRGGSGHRAGRALRSPFVGASLLAALLAPGHIADATAEVVLPSRATDTLRILLLLDAQPGAVPESVQEGATFGGEEARHAAVLLGRDVQLLAERVEEEITPALVARRIRERRASVVIGGTDAVSYAALAAGAAETRALFLNVAYPRADEDRCQPTTWSIAASAEMRRDAAAMAEGPDAEVLLWHASLFRFGAAQLNERFLDRFGRPMDSSAWASWLAVKVAWEASSRARSTDGDTLAEHLSRATTRFDGHKGRALTFRVADRQLRQPLYLAARGASASAAVPTEVPRPDGTDETRALLDRLGGSTVSACAR